MRKKCLFVQEFPEGTMISEHPQCTGISCCTRRTFISDLKHTTPWMKGVHFSSCEYNLWLYFHSGMNNMYSTSVPTHLSLCRCRSMCLDGKHSSFPALSVSGCVFAFQCLDLISCVLSQSQIPAIDFKIGNKNKEQNRSKIRENNRVNQRPCTMF